MRTGKPRSQLPTPSAKGKTTMTFQPSNDPLDQADLAKLEEELNKIGETNE